MSEPVNLSLEYRDDCLMVRASGRYLIEQKEAAINAIATAIKARPIRATLIDMRDILGEISFADRYELGELAARYLTAVPIGCLGFPQQADPGRIGKVVANNRGARVEIFTDPVIAEAWLSNMPALDSKPPTGTA